MLGGARPLSFVFILLIVLLRTIECECLMMLWVGGMFWFATICLARIALTHKRKRKLVTL